MMNMNNPKTKRIIAGVIAAFLILAMVIPMLIPA